jgi:hypothetical protein
LFGSASQAGFGRLPAMVVENNGMVAAILEHDPEKWAPVFGKDHAPTIS